MDYFEYKGQDLYAEDVRLDWLFADKVGTPSYIYSQRTMLEHYRKLVDAFAEVSAEVHYSVKACSNLAVLRLFAAQRSPEPRHRLVIGLLRRLSQLASSGIDLGRELKLRDCTEGVARLELQDPESFVCGREGKVFE